MYFSEPFVPEIGRVLQSALIDRRFPLFPWLGFAFFGSGLFASFSRGSATVRDWHVLASGLGLLAVGAGLLLVPIPGIESIADGTVLESRGGYSDIFYPATPGYILTGIGAFLPFSWCSARVEHAHALSLFAFFGRHSLMVYIMHQALGVFPDPEPHRHGGHGNYRKRTDLRSPICSSSASLPCSARCSTASRPAARRGNHWRMFRRTFLAAASGLAALLTPASTSASAQAPSAGTQALAVEVEPL